VRGVVSPGTLAETKEVATALMVITVAVSVYGGVRSREINRVLPAFFGFAAVFSIALWASAVLGLNLITQTTSTGSTTAYYVTAAWVNAVIIILALTLATVIFAIIAINDVLALRSFIADMRTWTEGEVDLLFPAAAARATASVLKEAIKGLFIMAYIYAVTTAAVASYLTFLKH
jgi:hypothetical protein